MSQTVTELSRKVPRCLPVLIAVAVVATVLTRYTVHSCGSSVFGQWMGTDTTAVATFAAHAHSPTAALRVVALNSVRHCMFCSFYSIEHQNRPVQQLVAGEVLAQWHIVSKKRPLARTYNANLHGAHVTAEALQLGIKMVSRCRRYRWTTRTPTKRIADVGTACAQRHCSGGTYTCTALSTAVRCSKR